jgi:NAD-dependent deacetylase
MVAEVSSAVMTALREAIDAIRERRPTNVVVFTGAGVSADSGIPTFRGAHGLWRNFRSEDLATPAAFARDPKLVWEWYEWRRELIRNAQPNPAHLAIARLTDALVVTQNVDGLHARAGSRSIVELHGSLFRVRCVREHRTADRFEALTDIPPHCECGSLLRPDVVWFGEMLPEHGLTQASAAILDADLLLVVGTSGVVYPAAGLVGLCNGLTIDVNPEAGLGCQLSVPARAADAVPPLVEAILNA